MKWTNITLPGLFVALLFTACGQSESGGISGGTSVGETGSGDKAAIEQRLGEYIEATNAKEWEESFNYLSPIIFDIAPRDQMIAAFEQMDATGFTINVKSWDITDYEKLVAYNGTRYTKFSYDCEMDISLGDGEEFSDPIMVEMMSQQMISQYGEENVQYDSTANSFDIDATRTVWAITGPEEKWYFVEENPQLDMVLDQIVPDTVQTMMGL